MKVVGAITDIREQINTLKSEGKKVAFVPTMGALHAGHISLIDVAKKHADIVVVSIFVNPTQFGPNEDFDKYPRTTENDLDKCKVNGVDIVFLPTTEIMYGTGERYFSIEIKELNEHLDGGSRPGFFQGITLVVNKLFNIVRPHYAVFGQKDYQQYRILQKMVEEFNHEVELVMAPIVREKDGLAMSSRNAYLSDGERQKAPFVYQTLLSIKENIQNGEDNLKLLLQHKRDELEAKGFKNDYLNVFALEKMWPAKELKKGNTYLLAIAVYLGKTRLIDNILFEI